MKYGLLNSEIAREIAKDLLSVGAIKLQPENPFTWSSGWKSPIYCDNRITLSYPSVRGKIRDYLSRIIIDDYNDTNAIAGVATAGIAQGALIADKLSLPFLYIRSKPKGHGMENMIEGRLNPGDTHLVVEDLISTGGSSLKAVDAIRNSGGHVSALVSIFNYGFPHALDNCTAKNVDVVYLSDYETLLEEALDSGIVNEDQISSLSEWRSDPGSWTGV